MTDEPRRYRSHDDDSDRWSGFPFRDGDIVISTRSKNGTTWMQMICALLVFGTPTLPDALSTLSPWLDWLITPRQDVVDMLEAQAHRRIIKTHTPLDGVPIDDRATYIVVARHPLDMAVSLYHHVDNIDRERLRELIGQQEPDAPKQPPRPRQALHESVLAWIDRDGEPADDLDSLVGVMWHLTDAWARRDQRNIVLVHYDDLSTDLSGEMHRIAERLGIAVPVESWSDLVEAATFASMRANAQSVAPDRSGVLKDKAAFFRRGTSGSGRELLTDTEFGHYLERASSMAPPDMLAWLHRATPTASSPSAASAASAASTRGDFDGTA